MTKKLLRGFLAEEGRLNPSTVEVRGSRKLHDNLPQTDHPTKETKSPDVSYKGKHHNSYVAKQYKIYSTILSKRDPQYLPRGQSQKPKKTIDADFQVGNSNYAKRFLNSAFRLSYDIKSILYYYIDERTRLPDNLRRSILSCLWLFKPDGEGHGKTKSCLSAYLRRAMRVLKPRNPQKKVIPARFKSLAKNLNDSVIGWVMPDPD